jgi:hypothetical protein
MFGKRVTTGSKGATDPKGDDMAVYACTSCGWVRRLDEERREATCEVCGAAACCLTPNGELAHRRAQLAAATARALHSSAR